MNINLKIFDTKRLPSNGKFILCCTDEALDILSNNQIVNLLTSTEVRLFIFNNYISKLHINSVEISSSIIDKKNIYLLIDDDITDIVNINNGYLKLVANPI